MTDPKEWKEADLQRLIAEGVEESLELDYKACDALQNTDGRKNEISKDISSFANSIGGTILYGMRERDHKPEGVDVGFDPTVVTKEWLEQVINSRIHPRIDGLVINPVQLTSGKQVYVVCIPQSDRAPHQAYDKKYYKRYNFESVPMEDYEVRDVMFRQRFPMVRIKEIVIAPRVAAANTAQYQDFNYTLQPLIENEGRVVAQHYAVEFDAREPISAAAIVETDADIEHAARLRKERNTTVVLLPGIGCLYPSQKEQLVKVLVTLRVWKERGFGTPVKPLPIRIAVYADSMPAFVTEYDLLEQQDVRNALREAGFWSVIGW